MKIIRRMRKLDQPTRIYKGHYRAPCLSVSWSPTGRGDRGLMIVLCESLNAIVEQLEIYHAKRSGGDLYSTLHTG